MYAEVLTVTANLRVTLALHSDAGTPNSGLGTLHWLRDTAYATCHGV